MEHFKHAGDEKVKEPKIRIAKREGLLCNPCYNEKTVAITRNTEIEPLTSEQGRNCCDLKEKVKQCTKWNVYSHRQRKGHSTKKLLRVWVYLKTQRK